MLSTKLFKFMVDLDIQKNFQQHELIEIRGSIEFSRGRTKSIVFLFPPVFCVARNVEDCLYNKLLIKLLVKSQTIRMMNHLTKWLLFKIHSKIVSEPFSF